MLSSILFFLCVALNTWLIWLCLSRPLRVRWSLLVASLARSRRYFSVALTPAREIALRRRTLVLLRRLGAAILGLAGILLFYGPSMVFAHYRSGLGAAFYSPEALAGMLVGAAAIGWRRRKS